MRRVALLALCLAAGACANPVPVGEPAPVSPPETVTQAGTLPPITPVEGALALQVVYPTANALIASRDSNFIFGSVGSGRATLEINSVPVHVHPNGAFLAFLPIPPAESAKYVLRATTATDTATLDHPVRLLPPPILLADTGVLVVDSGSVQPRPGAVLRASDPVRIAVRAPRNASVWVEWPVATPPQLVTPGSSRGAPTGPVAKDSVRMFPGGMTPLASGRDSLAEAVVLPVRDPYRWLADVPAAALGDSATIVVARGADTVRLPVPRVTVDVGAGRLAVLAAPALVAGDSERVVVGRSIPDPAGTSKWFLLPGTVVETTGRIGAYARIRLDSALEIWVDTVDVTLLAPGAAPPRPNLLSARVTPDVGWVDLALPIGERVPFLIEEEERALVLTLYGLRASVDAIAFARNDSLVRSIEAVQEMSDRARLTIHLDAPPFGWQTRWDDGRFVVRIRRPPRVDDGAPLRGLTIAVDPGHPPIGATGPTGLYEGDAVLEIARRAQRILEQRGATVVMTRTTPDPVALGDRPIIARRANAHAFVSFHLNAYPDGVNPFVANGTGTYFYFAHSERLARAVQRGMVRRMGLRDVGVFQQSFAVIRNSWMPAVLCEGAFLMIPEQEAALRTPAFQEAYARGVVDGLEDYFRSLETRR